MPGFVGLVTLEPGDTPYTSPPVVGADNGPDCHGMPDLDGSVFPESLMKNVDKGGEPNPDGDNTLRIGDPPLVTQLFGPFAGAGQELGLPGEQLRPVPSGQPAPAPADPAAPVPAAPGTESAPPAVPRESDGFLGGLFGGEGGR